ncbi:putative RecB family nuclease [Catenulispora sp. MAP12-49]|uniref:helix-hairpin-helix domain-containing protein n=1 Tax=Catenulispora sp. MAP12-49 TaxID=3156302 RepID=UPI0035189F6A
MSIEAQSPLAELGFTTQAPKTLAAAGVTTVEQLLAQTRDAIAALRGMGAARLADIDTVMAAHRLVYGQPFEQRKAGSGCKTCRRCPECGNPRADDRRHVATDWTGRASHIGHRLGPTCEGCHAHHLTLFTMAGGASGRTADGEPA